MVSGPTATKKAEKVVPPSPPRVIKDRVNGTSFTRVGFLGEGGFARVWEVQDYKKRSKAVKVVYKPNIKSKKNKTKLWAEIKLHQMMQHPNIVSFDDCFEDEDNVYMMLELCENGSLMDLLRRRKRYTEPEARLILVQLIAACQYMHQTNVIHRDLKLGNLFFDRSMNVKVGDFGLAALIENPGDRKKTICGTPNYIAPEVLFDQANGHSFEVDIWSVGVILYTLLIGKPPFQTKDINAIYKRIRDNRYEFPPDKEISPTAQQLIMSILNPNPQERPTLEAILQHRWFHDGPFPPYVPVTAFDCVPSFEHLTTAQWRRNFESALQRSKFGAHATIATPASRRDDLGPSIIQQDKDFRYAVQPDSPVGALIQSARQPLVQAPAQIKEPTLLRKLSAAGAQSTLSPVRRAAAQYRSGGAAAAGPASGARHMAPLGEEAEEEEDDAHQGEGGRRERELANQKARIVSEMATLRKLNGQADSDAASAGGREEADPRKRLYSRGEAQSARAEPSAQSRHAAESPRRPLEAAGAAHINQAAVKSETAYIKSAEGHEGKQAKVDTRNRMPDPSSGLSGPSRRTRQAAKVPGLFEVVGEVLTEAFEAAETQDGYLPDEEILDAEAPDAFVVSWLDYCQKYGMGFAMNDGTVSVHFNDSSSICWSPSKVHVDYLVSNTATGQFERFNHRYSSPPAELGNKVFLLQHFEKYIRQRLYGVQPYLHDRHIGITTGMVFVKRYLRMKHVIIFRLSNGVVQFNFYDHTKVIISQQGQIVSFIDKTHKLHVWSLEELLRDWKNPGLDRGRVKRVDGVVYKLQYCRDVLIKVNHRGLQSTAGEMAGDVEEERLESKPARVTRSTAAANGASGEALERPAQKERYEQDRRGVRAIR